MFGLFGGHQPFGGTFSQAYRCYPVSFIDKLDAENGDKIFLPPSALDRLGMCICCSMSLAMMSPQNCAEILLSRAASLQIEYPMMFKVENRRGGRHTHCGVLEFIADEGLAYMPYWVSSSCHLLPASYLSMPCLHSAIKHPGAREWEPTKGIQASASVQSLGSAACKAISCLWDRKLQSNIELL